MPNSDENDSSPSEVLDTDESGPYIPPQVTHHPLGLHPLDMAAPPPPAEEDLIVEVELAPGIDVDQVLNANVDSEDETGESKLATVLRTHGVLERERVFTPEQVEIDNARVKTLRENVGARPRSAKHVARLEKLPPLSNFVRLRFPPGTAASQVISSLKELPEVTRAVVVPRAAPPAVPNDPLIGNDGSSIQVTNGVQSQWYLHRTRVPEAWSKSLGKGVVIADVDWGFLTSHQDFDSAIERTFNSVDGTSHVTEGPKIFHGTGVLGIAGARANGSGIAGYAPEAALWAIQGDSGTGPKIFQEPWAEAIDFVARTDSVGRPKVIIVEIETFPLAGNFEQVPSVNRAIRAAISHGCIVCVAAGNGNRPADLDDHDQAFEPTGSILVGATAFHESENRRTDFSNFGESIVVSAPGDEDHDVTCGTSGNNAYRNHFGGTSGATPKVAGTVALMLSVNPHLDHDDIREILAATGSPIDEDDPEKPIGKFLNTEAAVAEALHRLQQTEPHE